MSVCYCTCDKQMLTQSVCWRLTDVTKAAFLPCAFLNIRKELVFLVQFPNSKLLPKLYILNYSFEIALFFRPTEITTGSVFMSFLKSVPLNHKGYSGISMRRFSSGRSSLSSVTSCTGLRKYLN